MLWILILILGVNLASSKDIPCSAMEAVAGYVCVCNETYCDTITFPSKFKKNSFYHYMTSEQSPGFTTKTGKFYNHTLEEELYNNKLGDIFITVNADIEYQTFEGVGASFTDCSGIAISSLGPGARQNLLESFYGATGIEYTFARVPMAAADFSTTYYTYDDVPGDVELEHFNLTDVDHFLKIPMIAAAMNVSKRGLKLLATPWTAPSWMKTNNGSRAGYIRNEYMEVWAKYNLRFFEAYAALGVNFWAVTLGNEGILPVYFGSFFPIQDTIWMPAHARYFTKKYLGPLLKNSDFKDVKILMLDDERPFMRWYSKTMYSDVEAAQYIDGIALHWYFDSAASVPLLDEYNQNYPDKFILYSESSINGFQSGGGSVNLGDWSRATLYIENVFQNYGHWVIGYIDWNIALNEDGGPTGPMNMTLDASVIINTTNGEFYKQPIFYALGHFSKFILPGSKSINFTMKQNPSYDIEEDLFIHPLQNELMNDIVNNNPTGPPPTGTPTGTPPTGTPTGTPPGPPPTGTPTGTPPGPPPSGSPTSPFPTRGPHNSTVMALATKNPDGSCTLLVYNPKSDPANVIMTHPGVGTLKQTIDANSINSFVYLCS